MDEDSSARLVLCANRGTESNESNSAARQNKDKKARRRVVVGLSLAPALLTVFLTVWGSASARSLFEITVASEGTTVSRGFSDAEDFARTLDNSRLSDIIPAYTENSAVDATLDVRGLEAIASYPQNSTTLRFQVPCSGTDLSFTGATRDDSSKQLRDYLKGRTGSVTDIMQCLVSDTAVDPVAGNPNSLMATMAASDYRVGTTLDGGLKNLFGIFPSYGHSKADGFETNAISLPLNYVVTIPNPGRPPYAVTFDLPIRYLNVEGADVVDGSLGVGFRLPLVSLQKWAWALTPAGRAGVVGSVNAGALQAVYSGTITSNLDYFYKDLRISLNNMLGYYTTGAAGRAFEADYGLTNGIIRTGVAVEGSLNYRLFDEPTSWEFQYVDTRVVGDDWFNSWYSEAVVTFGTRQRPTRMSWQDLRLGASYAFARDFDRTSLVLGYRF